MADITRVFYIENSDGTAFSTANNPGALVRLRNSTVAGANSSEYTGNTANSGDYTEVGYGKWEIEIDNEDSGYFLVQTSTGGAWSNVNGYDPVPINLEPFLALDGGTMSGNIIMGDNSVTGIDTLTFTDVDGTVAGIANKNLVDKSATEAIAGAWDFDGDCTVTAGSFDFTVDKLKVDSIKVSPYIVLTYNKTLAANCKTANVNGTIWISDGNYGIVSIEEIHETAEATAGTCYLQFERLSGTEAKGTGDDILTNNTNNGFSLKNAAKTIWTGTLNAAKAFADNDRLGIVLSANGTELAGLHITITLQRA
ncbi:MAG: hypothetical protein H8D22_03925 [Candidatus Cloacimonetes bacterium]|nr:hypothetical protein [Candidatus Cloacimonadota bacterium]